jgi:hypothetical protein
MDNHKRLDEQAWQPGEVFWIVFKCVARLEGEFIFWFKAGLATGSAIAKPVSLSKGSNLNKLSGLIPQRLEYFANGNMHLRVYSRGSLEACFDIGFLYKNTTVVTKE